MSNIDFNLTSCYTTRSVEGFADAKTSNSSKPKMPKITWSKQSGSDLVLQEGENFQVVDECRDTKTGALVSYNQTRINGPGQGYIPYGYKVSVNGKTAVCNVGVNSDRTPAEISNQYVNMGYKIPADKTII